MKLSLLLIASITLVGAGCVPDRQYEGGPTVSVRPRESVAPVLVSFSVTTDGRHIVFDGRGDGGSGIFRLDLNDMSVSVVIDSAAEETSPSVNDAGDVVYSSRSNPHKPAHLYLKRSTGPTIQLTRGGQHDEGADFSPGGKSLVFARAARLRSTSTGGLTWDDWDLHKLAIDSVEGPKPLTRRKYAGVNRPIFAPDGKSIIYTASTHGGSTPGSNLYVLPAAGGIQSTPRLLGRGSEGAYSPDGSRLVFIEDSPRRYEYELWLMKSDGTERRRITDTGKYKLRPVYHGEGKRIWFLHYPDRKGYPELWELDVVSGQLRKVADRGLFEVPLNWKPPGS